MTQEDLKKDTAGRIKADLEYFNYCLPERYTIAWNGYVYGLYEWGYISQSGYVELLGLLPKISDSNPILDIFTEQGRIKRKQDTKTTE